MTIEKLAEMVKRGFDQTATKDEVNAMRKEMATKNDLEALETNISNQIDTFRDSLRRVKTKVGIE